MQRFSHYWQTITAKIIAQVSKSLQKLLHLLQKLLHTKTKGSFVEYQGLTEGVLEQTG
jgi:hypothetical protein